METQSTTRYIDFDALKALCVKNNIKILANTEINSLTSKADIEAAKASNEVQTSEASTSNATSAPASETSAPASETSATSATKPRKVARQGIVLSDENVEDLMEELIRPFPKLEKVWADKQYRDQVYTMISFVPSKTAVPDKDGLFGLLKVRGVFSNEREMNDRGEEIIRTMDSYHPLLFGKVGYPLPLTTNIEKFSLDLKEIDLEKKVEKVVSDDVKAKREEEAVKYKEVEQRKKEILERNETKSEQKEEADFDRYIGLQVKRANLIFAVQETDIQRLKYLHALKTCIEGIAKIDREKPEMKEGYLEMYKKACDESGIKTDNNQLIKYMVADVPFEIPEVLPELPAEPTPEEKKSKITYGAQ